MHGTTSRLSCGIDLYWEQPHYDPTVLYGYVGPRETRLRVCMLTYGTKLSCYIPGPKGWREFIITKNEQQAVEKMDQIFRELLAALKR